MNTAAACGAILQLNGRILLLRRAKDPALGMLDFPGGFIDPGESAEAALQREIYEETGLQAADLEFLCSFPNAYLYRGITYPTCDLIFTGTVIQLPTSLQTTEVSEFLLLEPREVNLQDIAFPSLRNAFSLFLQTRTG